MSKIKRPWLWAALSVLLITACGLGAWYLIQTGILRAGIPAPAPSNEAAPPQPATEQEEPPDSTDLPEDAFALRGVIEGFYGEPWTHQQRLDMLLFMARHRYNTYVYAPKDDPYQRKMWSALYPPDKLEAMRSLAETAAANNIRFVYSISPGLPVPLSTEKQTPEWEPASITFSSREDRDRLEAKLDQLRSIGIHTFMLSFDDIQERLKAADKAVYGSDYAAAHMELANELLQRQKSKDPGFQLWFAPTVYRGIKDHPYWAELRKKLDPSIEVIWTGERVLSKTITSAQADLAAGFLGRKPLIWDNYPVNDYTYTMYKAPQLFLGPLENRSADLAKHTAGFLSNPMVQPESSKIALATIAAYLTGPQSYNPQTAWDKALLQMEGIGDPAAFRAFASYSRENEFQAVGNPQFQTLAQAYWKEQDPQAKQVRADRLRQELKMVAGLPSRLNLTIHNTRLLEEIGPWINKLGQAGELALLTLDYTLLPEDNPEKKERLRTLRDRWNKLHAIPNRIGPEITAFIEQALGKP
ncbi:MAG: hypothetical protein K0S39_1565 [Paenibacillus sp.]|jgi:hyaluronoglucosaminidase|nr:hypothetical protein [Paenibacillus sp.]